jgi:hypothetical protein
MYRSPSELTSIARPRALGRVSRSPPVFLGSIGLLALLLLLTPSALASPTSITLTAPYPHAAISNSNSATTTSCGTVQAHHAHWSSITGLGHFAYLTRAKHCAISSPLVATGSTAYGYSESTLSVPLKTLQGAARASSVLVQWNLTANGTSSYAIKSACPSVALNPVTGNGSQVCDAGSYTFLDAGAYLYDATNGTFLGSTNVWNGNFTESYEYNDTYCAYFSCANYASGYNSTTPTAITGTLALSFWINTTLDHFHQYDLVTYVEGGAYSYVDGYAKVSATAFLDLATLGNHDDLTKIVIS